MAGERSDADEWERLLAAERRLQVLLPGAVLVGGTAAALHAGHRRSLDGDHTVNDLRERFDQVLGLLESTPGWQTARVQRPVLILGRLDGFETGVRQLRRSGPLQTEVREGLVVPTLAEMARVKAWLLLERNSVRDHVDAVVLLEKLGEGRIAEAFTSFDALYGRGPGAGAPSVELVERLAAARPGDLADIDLATYKGIVAPWDVWQHVAERGRFWASRLAALVVGPRSWGESGR